MDATITNRTKMGQKNKKRIATFIRYVVILVFAVPMVLPLLWMLTTALKTDKAVFSIPPQWIPHQFQFYNFVEGLKDVEFGQRFINTSIITIFCIIGTVMSSMIVGYAISRIKFPGRKIWFYMIVGSMMLPGAVSMLPVFHFWSKLGFYNTWIPLIVPAFLGNPFNTFLVRQFMSTIPGSFDEAAKIDGANHWQIFKNIMIPMCKPVIAIMAVQSFTGTWNDYQNPLIYLIDPKKWTLALAMGQFQGGTYGTKWNLYMAADIIYLLPALVLFFLAQDYFMQGFGSMNSSGIK